MRGRATAQDRRRCGALVQSDGSVLFRLWAPFAKRVQLVLLDGSERRSLAMEAEPHGFYSHSLPAAEQGLRYAFRLDDGPERPDPCSLWQPDGVHAASAVVRPEQFIWSDQAWRGVGRSELVIYELHVGTFTPEGTFDAIIPRLESLKQLGVTALEIMPVAQFPGTRNWGYDGVAPYAAQQSYGGPLGLQRLVDACHQTGLAAILDVVYNHLGPEGNYLSEFGPYFTDHYRTPWGSAVNFDGRGSDPVRDYVLDNARMWLDEFHFDGLRLDAVHAIYDYGAKHILSSLKDAADGVEQRTQIARYIIAESDLNDPRLLLPLEKGGYGLDMQWSDDFHHTVHAFLTGERQGYYEDFGDAEHLARVLESPFVYAGEYSPHRDRRHGAPAGDLPGDRFVVSIQNHDQVGNRARGDRFGTLLAPPVQRLAASLLLLSPHVPMIFMGDEYGEKNPFQFFCSFCDEALVNAVRAGRTSEFAAFKWQGEVPDPNAEQTFRNSQLSWSWPEGSVHDGLRRLYSDLLAARRLWPALRDFEHRGAELLTSGGRKLLRLIRGGNQPSAGQTVTALFNLSAETCPLSEADIADAGAARLFSSEAPRYQGARPAGDTTGELLPHECAVFGPPAWQRFL